jgi:PAS domain S-box-containing protein
MLDERTIGRALAAQARSSPYGIAIVAPDSRVLHTNHALADLLGVPSDGLVGRRLRDFVHPADRRPGRGPGSSPPEHWDGRPRRLRLVRTDGGELVVLLSVTAVSDGSGPPSHLVVQALPDVEDALDAVPEQATGPRVPLRVVQARGVQTAATELAGAVTVADVTAVMERQLHAFDADGLLISLTDGPRLRLVSSRGFPDEVLARLFDQPMDSAAPMVDVVHRRTAMFVESLEEYLAAYPHRGDAARLTGKQAWAFLPMVAGGRVIGSWCLSFPSPHRFTVSERALLTTLSGLLAQAVARSEVLAAERSLSRTLQRSLLPASLPEVPGCRIEVRYSTAVAGLEVGGDFYDVVPLPGGGTGIVIGDAQGHSAAAAALMGQVRAALRAYAAEGHDPATIVARANRFLVTAGVDSFVTCTYAALDATHDGITIVRAGHPEPILVTPDGASGWLEVPGGLPLGIDPQAAYPVTWFPLTVGCRVVLYTDGLVEQRGSALDVGERQLMRRVREGAGLELADFADRVLDEGPDGQDPAREDDVAVLVLERVAHSDVARRQATFSASATDRAQVREVRRGVVDRCHDWGWHDRADEVELLVSELVTNAVVHVGGTVLVTVTASDRQLTVSVADTSVHAPSVGTADLFDTSGRGLGIVAELADEWGVDPSGPGKSVWFSMVDGAGLS